MRASLDSRSTAVLRERERIVDGVLRSFDLLAVAASFPIAYFIRDGIFGEKAGQPGLYPIARYWPVLVLTLLSWVFVSRFSQLYQAHRLRTIASEVLRVGRTLIMVAAIMAAVGFLAKQAAVSRLFVCFYFATSMGMLFANRLLLRSILRVLRRHGYTTRIFAVVGTSEVAREVAEGIIARREWGYHFAGYIEENDAPAPRQVGPVIGSLSKLQQILDNKILDEIIFAVSQERLEDIEAAVLQCRGQGVTARICLDFSPRRISKLRVDELNGVPMLGVY